MDIKSALAHLVEGKNLSSVDMQSVMRHIMTGNATDSQIAGFLVALRLKGETAEEIAAAASVMRDLAVPVSVNVERAVDIVGTGGDSLNLFNVSSASAFVVASAGGHVAKHGNRSVSSNSGSADLLEAAGLKLDLNPEQIAKCINEVGLGFMFAPQHHKAMRYAIGPRKEMAIRTLFNVLGPLTNPARVKHYLLGVYDVALCRPMAEALRELGAVHALVVHAENGLDEISLQGATHIAELKQGQIEEYSLCPTDVGLEEQPLDDLRVESTEQSLALINSAFAGENPKAVDMIALNAGAALYAADLAGSLNDGVAMAKRAIIDGRAQRKMTEMVHFSQSV